MRNMREFYKVPLIIFKISTSTTRSSSPISTYNTAALVVLPEPPSSHLQPPPKPLDLMAPRASSGNDPQARFARPRTSRALGLSHQRLAIPRVNLAWPIRAHGSIVPGGWGFQARVGSGVSHGLLVRGSLVSSTRVGDSIFEGYFFKIFIYFKYILGLFCLFYL